MLLRKLMQRALVVQLTGSAMDKPMRVAKGVGRGRANILSLVSPWIVSGFLCVTAWSTPAYTAGDQANTQIAQLYELQAAFHRAASVHDPVNGDSVQVIDQRIRDMLSLWTVDASLTLATGSPFDGTYTGQGDPDNASTCPTPSTDPTNRGTLCTFFKYVAGSFQPQNKFVSLAPAYKTQFGVNGNTAAVYFECHYFNIATDPAGNPLWTAASHVNFDGFASKVNGNWLFSESTAKKVGIPIP